MVSFALIEGENGYAVIEVLEGQSAEEAALNEGGILVDMTLFDSYEDACDALDQLQEEYEDRN